MIEKFFAFSSQNWMLMPQIKIVKRKKDINLDISKTFKFFFENCLFVIIEGHN